MPDNKHSLFVLANLIDWSGFEDAFAPLFSKTNGRPPKPIRLMTALLVLKHLRNVSDEQVVLQFQENAYYQYFCGMERFTSKAPCAASELVHFRNRIGEGGIELILKVARVDRRMRTIAGRLVRELMRKLPKDNIYKERLDLFMKFISGEKYDGHTIDRSMEQVNRIYGRKTSLLAGDRGYKGQDKSGETDVIIPGVPKASDSAYAKLKKHKIFRKWAGIKPIIGHCKSDHRLGRNFYKGLFGDPINVMLAAAAFNLKRMMNALVENIIRWSFGPVLFAYKP